jgi:drug/metabolite transporter (DMT)-like permease
VKTTGVRIGSWAVAAVIGFVYGVAGVIGQAAHLGSVPVGLIVALIGLAALLLAIRLLTEERGAVFAAGMGALIATLVFSGRGPGGSVVVPAAPDGELSTGVIWTIAAPLVAAVIVAWPRVRVGERPPAGTN